MTSPAVNRSLNLYNCPYNTAVCLSYFFAGFFASLLASYVAKIKGRKICMIISGICYLIGAGLTTGAVPRQSGLGMLIVGRIMLGVGVGFANSVSITTI